MLFLDSDEPFSLGKREFHCLHKTAFFLRYQFQPVNNKQHLLPDAFVEEGCLIKPMHFAVDLDAREPFLLQSLESLREVLVTF